MAQSRYPFVRENTRIRPRHAMLAFLLTGAQVAFILLAWHVRPADDATSPELLPVDLLREDVTIEPDEPDPAPEREAPESESAPPPPAPLARPVLPEPPLVLTRELLPPAPVTPPVVAPIAGDGLAISTGDGVGNGRGNSTGDGAGTGRTAPPARELTTTWAPSMNFRLLRRYYPREARDARLAGYARLDCEVIERDRIRDCRVIGETPSGHGFGEAALDAERVYRIRVHDQNGERVYGERIQLNAHFTPRD